jgi:hypothetical protein
MGISGLRVATVLGDDLMTRLDSLRGETTSGLTNLDTGEPFDALPAPPLFASAYLGAFPIAEALAQGADIVITGRVADAALFLGPMIHEHGWARDDWDRLSAGMLVGHLLECSGQVAGGNFSGEWWTIPEPWKLPYPIAEVSADGSAVITKPKASGGRVDVDTVRHQLLYEVHDPASYFTPDVVADFTSARFEDLGSDRVRVSDVRGKPATDTYKALLAYHAGWAGETRVAFSWPDAHEKAKATAAILAKRVEMAGIEVREWCFEYWGVNALGGPTVPPLADGVEPPECVLRAAWRCDDARTASSVGREVIPLTLSAPPAGLTGMGRGMASASTEQLGLWPTLVDKQLVDPGVTVTIEEI